MEDDRPSPHRTLFISGAGIAGLACALFASKAGYRVELYEQSAKLDPIGSGLQLSPNAMHVLAQLGLDRQVKSVANAPVEIEVYPFHSDQKITSIPLGVKIVQKYAQPYLVIHRADLQRILATACKNDPDIHLLMGHTIRDAVLHPNGVSIITDSAQGTQTHSALGLIGADGVHSVIRTECFECGAAKSTGTLAYRALVRNEAVAEQNRSQNTRMWLAPNIHAVAYPIGGERYTNLVLTVSEQFDQSIDGKLTGAKIAEKLSRWHPDFKQFLDINTDWTRWPLFAAPKLANWQEGCILLVGDAAHAMTPHAAQGAAMALEDAATLGWALTTEPTLETAFGQYQHERFKRVNAVVSYSEKNRQIFQLQQPFSTFRNLGMKIIGGKGILKRQDWIYRWRPPVQRKNQS